MMRGILVTNNPTVYRNYRDRMETIYIETAVYMDVLFTVRNKIHDGHSLLSHPLSGSIKPNTTPYKSIIITKEKSKLDIGSLKIMEDSIATAGKLIKQKMIPKWTDEILEDFQLIDFDLIKSGIESMEPF